MPGTLPPIFKIRSPGVQRPMIERIAARGESEAWKRNTVGPGDEDPWRPRDDRARKWSTLATRPVLSLTPSCASTSDTPSSWVTLGAISGAEPRLFAPALTARSPLREHIREQRDRGGVPAEILGPDLLERVGGGVVDVEVVMPVRLEVECRRARLDDRLHVGAEGVGPERRMPNRSKTGSSGASARAVSSLPTPIASGAAIP